MDRTTQAIAKRLKDIRLKRGITQAELADKASVSVNYYARIERAETNITVEMLEKLIRVLRVKSADILPF